MFKALKNNLWNCLYSNDTAIIVLYVFQAGGETTANENNTLASRQGDR